MVTKIKTNDNQTEYIDKLIKYSVLIRRKNSLLLNNEEYKHFFDEFVSYLFRLGVIQDKILTEKGWKLLEKENDL